MEYIMMYLVGCFFSFVTLTMCEFIKGPDSKMDFKSKFLGIVLSWIVTFLFFYFLAQGFIKKQKQHTTEKSDAEMIKETIDNYWVPATMYGREFDKNPKLPIKDSPLCRVYFEKKHHHEMAGGYTTHCQECPIHKAGFGCTTVGFYLRYQKSGPQHRKRSAMIVGKIFNDVYDKLK